MYARVPPTDFDAVAEGCPAKLVAKIRIQRDIENTEPKSSAKAARIDKDSASDKRIKAQKAYDRAQEAVVKAVANDVNLKAELAAAAHDELLEYLASNEAEDMGPASELGEKHGVRHSFVAGIFNNLRDQ
ncbi:unnamed protein product, partial [Prorocentrum cordatum]